MLSNKRKVSKLLGILSPEFLFNRMDLLEDKQKNTDQKVDEKIMQYFDDSFLKAII